MNIGKEFIFISYKIKSFFLESTRKAGTQMKAEIQRLNIDWVFSQRNQVIQEFSHAQHQQGTLIL